MSKISRMSHSGLGLTRTQSVVHTSPIKFYLTFYISHYFTSWNLKSHPSLCHIWVLPHSAYYSEMCCSFNISMSLSPKAICTHDNYFCEESKVSTTTDLNTHSAWGKPNPIFLLHWQDFGHFIFYTKKYLISNCRRLCKRWGTLLGG